MSTRASTRRAPIPLRSPGVPAVPVASRSLTWKIFTAPSAGRCAFSVAIPSGPGCIRSSRRAAASWCRSSAPSGSTMITACPVTSRSSVVVNSSTPGSTRSCRSWVCSGVRGRVWSAITLALTRSSDPCSRAFRVGARTPVIRSASATRLPAVWQGIRNAAATSSDASDAAASGTKCATCSGSSSLVMQFFRASTAASRIGSPATNGTASAASSRIWVPASRDSAFSDATTASTSAAPVIAVGSVRVNAVSDSAVAGAPASVAQSVGGVSWLGCWSVMVPPPEGFINATGRMFE